MVLQLLEQIKKIVKILVGLGLGEKWHVQVVIIYHTVTLLEKMKLSYTSSFTNQKILVWRTLSRVCDYRFLLMFNFTVKLDGVEGRSGKKIPNSGRLEGNFFPERLEFSRQVHCNVQPAKGNSNQYQLRFFVTG